MKANWWFVTAVYSLLVWLYIVVRIVVSKVDMSSPFIDGIPGNFWQLGIVFFTLSYICMIAGCAESGVLPRVRLVRMED